MAMAMMRMTAVTKVASDVLVDGVCVWELVRFCVNCVGSCSSRHSGFPCGPPGRSWALGWPPHTEPQTGWSSCGSAG